MKFYNGKLTKQDFEITLYSNSKETKSGFVLGNYGTYKGHHFYNVTELSSGCSVGNFTTFQKACIALRLLHANTHNEAKDQQGNGYTEDEKNFVKSIRKIISELDLNNYSLYGYWIKVEFPYRMKL